MSIRNAVIFLRDACARALLARGGEQNDVIGMIGVADEMLGAVDDEIAARDSTAVVFMPRRSDPAPGSVMARHSMRSPRTVGNK